MFLRVRIREAMICNQIWVQLLSQYVGQRTRFWNFVKNYPKNTHICSLRCMRECAWCPHILFSFTIGPIMRHAWFAHICTQNCTINLYKKNVVFELEHKECHMSAYHVCLINAFCGYICYILCNIKVYAHMWHILSRLNPIFLYILVKIQLWLKKSESYTLKYTMVCHQNSMF